VSQRLAKKAGNLTNVHEYLVRIIEVNLNKGRNTMSYYQVVDNWEVMDNQLVVHQEGIISASINIKGQEFKEGNVVEVGTDSIIKLGKPKSPMTHTKRICAIFKDIIKDLEKQERLGYISPLVGDVIAYTTKNTLPNIRKADVLGMIKELGY